MLIDWRLKSEQLRHDGYCVVPRLLSREFIARLREAADAIGPTTDDSYRSQGSMVPLQDLHDPVFGRLISGNEIRFCLQSLALDDAGFLSGFVISKPPRSPRLFWHIDWYSWDDSSSFEREPRQVFAMFYLTDTRPENGCLRVIPGSHMQRHRLHDLMQDGHRELGKAEDLTRPEFADWPDEVSVCVTAGDLVLGDARLLHAAHSNDSSASRTLITLWYLPHFDAWSERLKATYIRYSHALPDVWPQDIHAAVANMRIVYEGGAEPLDRTHRGPRPG